MSRFETSACWPGFLPVCAWDSVFACSTACGDLSVCSRLPTLSPSVAVFTSAKCPPQSPRCPARYFRDPLTSRVGRGRMAPARHGGGNAQGSGGDFDGGGRRCDVGVGGKRVSRERSGDEGPRLREEQVRADTGQLP